MEFDISPGRGIGGNNPCFIIAEIGQNHQGDVNIAKEMIKMAKDCGVDCVKFQKSDLQHKFNRSALARPYESPHAFGDTYGEHKTKLELSKEDFRHLKSYADNIGILFSASAMDEPSVDFLDEIGVPFFKVGSGDANNFPYLSYAAQKNKPMIISSGMQTMETMRKVYSLIRPLTKRFCFLQCTSSYPTSPRDVHLQVIRTYQTEFPDIPIGYSGHEKGISISIAAVALGAKVLERHVTMNKAWKGSDHQTSLEANELKELVEQVRLVELALGKPEKRQLKCESPCYTKLGKTIVARRRLKKGEIVTEDKISVKVAEPKGWKAEELYSLIGQVVGKDIEEDESIQYEDINRKQSAGT